MLALVAKWDFASRHRHRGRRDTMGHGVAHCSYDFTIRQSNDARYAAYAT
jgi:hypothetical protein